MTRSPHGESNPRIASLDALRGFTVFFMLFVNDAASVRDLPWWLYHMPHGVNGITPVDVVFPAFLFMVGAAIPLAIDRRRAAGASRAELAWHALTRALALVLMGILVMNGRTLDPAASGVPYGVWNGVMLSCLVLAWWSDPKADPARRRLIELVRIAAAVALVILMVVFRSRTPAEHHGWFDFATAGLILAIIGWSYLYAALVYLGARGDRRVLVAALAVFVAWNVAAHRGVIPITWLAAEFTSFGRAGSLSTVMAGVVAAKLLLGEGAAGRRLGALTAYALALTLSGTALVGFGVTKDGATPSYGLFCSAITALLLAAFYYTIDVRRTWSGWPFLSAGRNALVVYLIPDIFYAIVGVKWLGPLGSGWIGVLGSAVFAAAWIAIGAFLTRHRVRMQL
jgi:predicted acyltransferase